MTDVSLRWLKPTDSPALQELLTISPDTGRFAISPHYQIDPYRALTALSPGTVGVVAENRETGQIIGIGMVTIERRFLGGKLAPCAMLHSLNVHPAFRRQGVAARLAQWRIDYGRGQVGEDVVILAGIQTGNTASLAAARKWRSATIGNYSNVLTTVRSRPPAADSRWNVREAQVDEYGRIADHLNNFYQDYNLYMPLTAETLIDWLARTPFERPLRRYYVVVDQHDRLLAGMSVAEQFRVVAMRVQRMPVPARLLNRVVKAVPPDGILRQSGVNHIWFVEGQLPAARFLWQSIRWRLREVGTHVLCAYDLRSPVSAVVSPPFWLPKGSSVVAARTSFAVDDRLISQL